MSTFSKESDTELKEKIEKMSTEELLNEVERIKLELEDYEHHAEKICEKTGMSRPQIKEYIKNKKNFTKQEWDQLEKAREEIKVFKEEIWKTVGKTPPIEPENSPIKPQKPKEKQKRNFVGMKKQKWIPMD
jgi:hypothetical protein